MIFVSKQKDERQKAKNPPDYSDGFLENIFFYISIPPRLKASVKMMMMQLNKIHDLFYIDKSKIKFQYSSIIFKKNNKKILLTK